MRILVERSVIEYDGGGPGLRERTHRSCTCCLQLLVSTMDDECGHNWRNPGHLNVLRDTTNAICHRGRNMSFDVIDWRHGGSFRTAEIVKDVHTNRCNPSVSEYYHRNSLGDPLHKPPYYMPTLLYRPVLGLPVVKYTSWT